MFVRSSGVGFAMSLVVALGTVSACVEEEQPSTLQTAYASQSYPFGSRLDSYRYGIKPNHITSGTMDSTIRSHYDAWKAARVVDVPTVPGGKAVKFNVPGYLVVSEGQGYGMLLAVLMAGHDPMAQATFDALLKTVRARPAYSIPVTSGGPYLMDWRLTTDGSSTDAAGGGWNAMDGDLDIAMALLMADRQWGSSGTWNYKQEAIKTINALKAWNMSADGVALAKGGVSRTSDYMIGHFRAFAQATGDTFWSTKAIDRSYELVDRMQTVYSPNVGLMPDFIIDFETSSPKPSPGGRIESPYEGQFYANGQRNGWRWGTDYVFSGDPRWKSVLMKMSSFFVRDNGGTPGPAVSSWGDPNFIGNMPIGYYLNGSPMVPGGNPWPAIGLVAGAMNGAQVDASFQSYVNACWDWLEAKWTTNYYDSELTLLSMIVASGNWWNPTAAGGSAPTPTEPPPPPPPTTPTPPATGMRMQAESGALSGSGVAFHDDLAGYDGTGFVGAFTTAGDRLTVSFGNVAAGTYDVRIRYHAWTAQQNFVVINGASRSEAFPATGGGWATKTLAGVTLPAGTSTIAFLKEWGYTDVDYIELSPVGGAPTSGAPTTIHVQAEAGTLTGTGVGVRSDLAGFEGTGFVGSFTASGDTLTVALPNVVAGTYSLRIRYHAWTAQQNQLAINGSWRSQAFPATGSGWMVQTITGVALPAGTTTIAIKKEWGYTDIDWIEIAP